MKAYLDLLKQVLENGTDSDDRTGIGTRRIFGVQTRYDLEAGFPAVTSKKLAWKSVVGELLWFIEGSGDVRRLSELTHGVPDKSTIWTANAEAQSWLDRGHQPWDAGRIYGVQWRDWRTADGAKIDQLANLIDGLRTDPNGRRHILTAWNPGEMDQMCLPPCHVMSQFFVSNGKLSCQMYQRSADLPLGIPFNLASYSLLTHMIAQVCGLGVGEFIHVIGDAHIYKNQFDGVKEQLTREPYPLPTLWLNPDVKQIDSFTTNDIKLENYQSHSAVSFKMAV